MLGIIKTVHTLIWGIMAAACLIVLAAGITNTRNLLVWGCIGVIVLEGLILLVNRWACPLTPLARKYTTDERENFDIYLPLWLAKHNKTIFTTIFAAGVLLLILRS